MKKTGLFSTIALLLIISMGHEGVCQGVWSFPWGDTISYYVRSIEQVGGGVTAMTGNAYQTVQVMMLDSNRNELWHWNAPDWYLESSCTPVRRSQKNGYFLAYTNELNIVAGNPIFLSHLDSNGTIIRSSSFATDSPDIILSDLQPCSDGGCAIGGTMKGIDGFFYKALLMRTDSIGQLQWRRLYGGDFSSEISSFLCMQGKEFVFAGSTNSYNAEEKDVWIGKTNSLGDTLWTRTFGGLVNDEANCIRNVKDGGFIIAGYTESFGDGLGSDIWLLRVNEQGDTLWTRTFGGDGDDYGIGVENTQRNEFLVLGYSNDYWMKRKSAIMVCFDSTGKTIWSKSNILPYEFDLNSFTACRNSAHTVLMGMNKETGGALLQLSDTSETGIDYHSVKKPSLAGPIIKIIGTSASRKLCIGNLPEGKRIDNIGLFDLRGRVTHQFLLPQNKVHINGGYLELPVHFTAPGVHCARIWIGKSVYTSVLLVK